MQLDETQRALPAQSAFLDSMGQKMFVCPVWVVIMCPGNRMVKHVIIQGGIRTMCNQMWNQVELSPNLAGNSFNLFMIMVVSFADIFAALPTISAFGKPCGSKALIAIVCVLCVMGIAILYIVLVHESQKSRSLVLSELETTTTERASSNFQALVSRCFKLVLLKQLFSRRDSH